MVGERDNGLLLNMSSEIGSSINASNAIYLLFTAPGRGKPFGVFGRIMHRNLFDLDAPQIFGQARNEIIGAALRVRIPGILIF